MDSWMGSEKADRRIWCQLLKDEYRSVEKDLLFASLTEGK